jgi:ABC-type cobalt transport system substrate-binding protein
MAQPNVGAQLQQMHALTQEQQQNGQAQAAQQAAQIEALNQPAIAQGARLVAAEQAAGNGVQANGMPFGYKPVALPVYCGNTGEDIETLLFQVEQSQTLFPIAMKDGGCSGCSFGFAMTTTRWALALASPLRQ